MRTSETPWQKVLLPLLQVLIPIKDIASLTTQWKLLFKYPKYFSFCFFMKISNHWSLPNWLICSVQKVEDKILTVSHQDPISLRNCHIDLSYPGFLRFQTTMLKMTKIPRTKAPPTAAPITIPFLFSPLLFCASPVGSTLVAELDEAAVAVVWREI